MSLPDTGAGGHAGGDGAFLAVLALADDLVARREPALRWMWGDALLGYALTELDAELGEDRYLAFTRACCERWLARDPRVDQSDTAAPALVTWALQKRCPGAGFGKLTDRVLDYVRKGPRILGEALNHLGHSPEGWLYPRSVWVDSLMMFGVFPARYAAETGDGELLDFAARQPRQYAALLRDPGEGLWYHSYWVRAGRHHPRGKVFWGRGNGWVAAALPMILDWIPAGHPERAGILALFRESAAALLPWQRPDGWFATLLNRPARSYRESSATALIAAGWMHGLRRGWLGEEYREPALRAFLSVVDSLEIGPGGERLMPEISAPTIPLHLFPSLGYKCTPRGKNWSYGVAALIFAAIEHRKLLAGS